MLCLRCVVHNGGCPPDVWQGWNTGFYSRTLRESSTYFQVVRTLVSLEQLSTQYEKNDGWHIILDSKQKKVVSFDDVFWKRYWIRSHQVSWLYCYRPVSSVHWIYIANLAPIPEKSLIVMHIRTDRQKALESGKVSWTFMKTQVFIGCTANIQVQLTSTYTFSFFQITNTTSKSTREDRDF